MGHARHHLRPVAAGEAVDPHRRPGEHEYRHMTRAAAPSVAAAGDQRSGAVGWLRSKDPDLLVVKRSVRAAIVMPSVFAITHVCFTDPQVSLFAAFGSFALLLLVEFTGRVRTRLVSYLGLYVVGSLLHRARDRGLDPQGAAVVTMALVGFGVLFAGIVAPAGGDGLDRRPPDVRAPRRGGAAAFGDRPPAGGVDAGGRMLHHRLPPRLAGSLARQPPAPPLGRGLGRGPAGRRTGSGYARSRGARRRFVASWRSCASSSRGRRTRRPAPPRVPSRSQSWWAGSSGWRATPPCSVTSTGRPNVRPARAITEKVAETLHQAASLICDGNAHPVDDPARIQAVQDSTRATRGAHRRRA